LRALSIIFTDSFEGDGLRRAMQFQMADAGDDNARASANAPCPAPKPDSDIAHLRLGGLEFGSIQGSAI
jgi:hypothetical protein